MARRRGQRKGWLHEKGGKWLLTFREDQRMIEGTIVRARPTITIGPAVGPGKLTRRQAERFAWDHYLSKLDQASVRPQSMATVAEFVKAKFLPDWVAKKKDATQRQYRSILQTWIVPIIGGQRLRDVTPDEAKKPTNAALEARRSSETAHHIRKVLSAMFTHAKRLQFVAGDNPAGLIELPECVPVRESHALTWEQCRALNGALPSPAREMALLSIVTSMNVAEMCGLKWKRVNLDAEWSVQDGDPIPPRCLAVREHWYRGRAGTLKAGKRRRIVPLPMVALTMLSEMKRRPAWTGPDDFVFSSSAGTAVNENNLAKRTLKRVGTALGMPWLSWHVFRHTHATLTKTVGMSDTDRMRLMGHASMEMTDRYTHEDLERTRAGLELVTERILATSWQPGGVN